MALASAHCICANFARAMDNLACASVSILLRASLLSSVLTLFFVPPPAEQAIIVNINISIAVMLASWALIMRVIIVIVQGICCYRFFARRRRTTPTC